MAKTKLKVILASESLQYGIMVETPFRLEETVCLDKIIEPARSDTSSRSHRYFGEPEIDAGLSPSSCTCKTGQMLYVS